MDRPTNNGVHTGKGLAVGQARAWAHDVLGAIALAEGAVAQRIFVSGAPALPIDTSRTNAFGDRVELVGTAAGSPARHVSEELTEKVEKARAYAAAGERVTLVAPARALAAVRPLLRRIAGERLGLVFHALEEPGCPDLPALVDVGWGVLLSPGVEGSLDLSLVARRAAEDSGTPFFVVHERSAARHIEPLIRPDEALCEAFLGAPSARLRPTSDPAHPIHAKIGPRAYAERVPFALGSSMRELEALTGRRHDVVERSAGTDASVMLVGAGLLGDSLLGEVARLRARGHDVGALKVTALRPFPGPRLVRALARSLAVTVVEGADHPLAESNPLTCELKAAFADALTWASGYPGVGRIPRILSGVVGLGGHEVDALDFDAMVENMLEGERGKRFFTYGADVDLALPSSIAEVVPAAGSFAMRGVVQDRETAAAAAELCASVLGSALALRTRATVRAEASGAEGPAREVSFEVVASRERPRGTHTPHAVRLVVLEDVGALLSGHPLARLASGGIVAVPAHRSTPEALWAMLPPYAKSIVFDRGARVVGWPVPEAAPAATGAPAMDAPPTSRWLLAACFAGVALAALGKGPTADGEGTARPLVDGSLVAREVTEALRVLIGHDGASVEGGAKVAHLGGELARRAFEAHVEVPRATVEHDTDGVRMGRHDERASLR